ncbi:hypothetical protein NQ318_013473 [Aromia moschata]|uniref:Transposase n=1 Tax=Aromia moschata TaxID=1265417 RepID=A0AAV8YC95_9CUCU|nr:hypothetical protein NQ318_013473 [Aromia moschata]
MEFKSKVKNKVLSGQSREIIHSVLKFMKEEANVDGFVIPLAKVQERVAKATGVSIRTIKTIAQEARIIDHGEKSSFSTPNKKRKVTHTKTEVDAFDQRFLTRIIINFQLTEKETPSMKRIHEKFCLDTGYEGCVESLRKEVRKIGFRWRKKWNQSNGEA